MKKIRKPLKQQAVCIFNSTTVCFCKIKNNNTETNIIKKQKGDKEAKKEVRFRRRRPRAISSHIQDDRLKVSTNGLCHGDKDGERALRRVHKTEWVY